MALTGIVAASFGFSGYIAGRNSPPPSDKVASYLANPSPVVARPVAIMYGDSYFNGWTETPKHAAIAAQTANHLGYEVSIRGHGATGYASGSPEHLGKPIGSYVEQMDLEPPASKVPASLVVLQGGLADHQVPQDEFAAAFKDVVATVREHQPSAQIFVLGPANVYPWERNSIVDNSELQAQLCDELGLQFISVDELIPHEEFLTYVLEDGTHPNQEGADLLARRFTDELIKRGVEPHIDQSPRSPS